MSQDSILTGSVAGLMSRHDDAPNECSEPMAKPDPKSRLQNLRQKIHSNCKTPLRFAVAVVPFQFQLLDLYFLLLLA